MSCAAKAPMNGPNDDSGRPRGSTAAAIEEPREVSILELKAADASRKRQRSVGLDWRSRQYRLTGRQSNRPAETPHRDHESTSGGAAKIKRYHVWIINAISAEYTHSRAHIRSRGVVSCAAVISAQRQKPSPIPRIAAKPHTALPDRSPVVAMATGTIRSAA